MSIHNKSLNKVRIGGTSLTGKGTFLKTLYLTSYLMVKCCMLSPQGQEQARMS